MANKVTALALLLVVVAAALTATEAVTCSAVALASCAPAIMNNQPPSDDCCSKLREQKPCLCQYKKSPVLKPYVDSPGAQRVASACKVFAKC